ncbi:hypothetical protein [Comamonas sp.]|uniref:hypothetical protein n=1 Tax=Comamonas sp. TaxID=34028 RepID=UPI003A8F8289
MFIDTVAKLGPREALGAAHDEIRNQPATMGDLTDMMQSTGEAVGIALAGSLSAADRRKLIGTLDKLYTAGNMGSDGVETAIVGIYRGLKAFTVPK